MGHEGSAVAAGFETEKYWPKMDQLVYLCLHADHFKHSTTQPSSPLTDCSDGEEDMQVVRGLSNATYTL